MKLSVLLHLREVRTRTLCSSFISTETVLPPNNVSATTLSSTVILVEWEGFTQCRLVNGRIVGYRVQFTKPTDDSTPSVELEGTWNNASSCTLTGLTPSTNYTIAVAAVNEEGIVAPYSDPVIVETESAGEQSVV